MNMFLYNLVFVVILYRASGISYSYFCPPHISLVYTNYPHIHSICPKIFPKITTTHFFFSLHFPRPPYYLLSSCLSFTLFLSLPVPSLSIPPHSFCSLYPLPLDCLLQTHSQYPIQSRDYTTLMRTQATIIVFFQSKLINRQLYTIAGLTTSIAISRIRQRFCSFRKLLDIFHNL